MIRWVNILFLLPCSLIFWWMATKWFVFAIAAGCLSIISITCLVGERAEYLRFARKLVLLLTPKEVSAEFKNVYKIAKSKTLLSKRKCFVLWECVHHCKSLPGEFVELGVYRGGSARIIKAVLDNGRRLYLFDTFNGIPESCRGDNGCHLPGDFADTSLGAVKSFLGNGAGLVYQPGPLPDTLRGLNGAPLAFVHFDLDLYDPIKRSLAIIYKALVPGGMMLFDEYGEKLYRETERKAVDEFFADRAECPIELGTGQCVVVKQ